VVGVQDESVALVEGPAHALHLQVDAFNETAKALLMSYLLHSDVLPPFHLEQALHIGSVINRLESGFNASLQVPSIAMWILHVKLFRPLPDARFEIG
jgi:hypothetical protein